MRPELKTLTGGIEVALGPRQPHVNTPPPFFGRAPALEKLKAVAETVRSTRECRCVTVVGAAGIGKTRLIDEFVRASIRPTDEHPLRVFRSNAAADDSPWSCFTQLLLQRFDVVDALGAEEAKLGVRTQVASLLDDRKVGDVLHVLGALLGLEFPDSPLTKALGDVALDPSHAKRAILKSLLEADAQQGALCFILDDLHLAHEQTIGMVRFLVENLSGPVMFICAARPELLARPEGQPAGARYSVLHLEPLGEVDTAALIGSLLSPGGLTPMHVVEQAREVTGGNPGRIEETARFYRDRGTLPPPPSAPESALQARIDELAPADRLLLQRAALMGGVFWFGGLVVLDRADRDPPVLWNEEDDESRLDITDRLQRLMERDYVMRLPDSTFPGDEEYVFRHRLERDRISALTSPADARKWHRLLADWLDSKPEIRTHEQYLEMLAEQREKSGISDWAARAYLEAAGRARAHNVTKRELAYYEKALTLLGEHDFGRRLDSLLRIGELLEGLGRPEDALHRYRDALILAFRLDRRASWVAARLAMTRLLARLGLTDESMTHLESQIPPPPEVTIDVFDSTSNPVMPAAAAEWLVDEPALQQPVVPAEPVTAKGGSFPDLSAPVSAVVSSSRITWPDPTTVVPPMAYPSSTDPQSSLSHTAPASVNPATVASAPAVDFDATTAVVTIDPDATAVVTIEMPPDALPDGFPGEPAAAQPSPNPSDPGAEARQSKEHLELDPDSGVGMAAAATDGVTPPTDVN